MSTSSKTKTGLRAPVVKVRRTKGVKPPLPVIGWREWVGLPELELTRVKAKVDTGARSSCLDALSVDLVKLNRQRMVRFSVPYEVDGKTEAIVCHAPLVDQRWITSSDGRREFRPVIQTELSLFGASWSIEVTLTSRAVMGFRMLLGREAIRQRFVVDPGRSFVAEKAARLKKRKAAITKAKTA